MTDKSICAVSCSVLSQAPHMQGQTDMKAQKFNSLSLLFTLVLHSWK